ncbi:MAG TPA: hypothetical protein ENN21_04630 [Spirochaetes bacterium]|nr:hypothetical protein [Spirochaetota bacterium]
MGGRGSPRLAFLCLAMACFCWACAVESPVEGDYFNNLSRIKGGEKPTPPEIQGVTLLAGRELQITFTSAPANDPDTGTNDNLLYFVYYADGDLPPDFSDESYYYSEEYYLGYVRESDWIGDPKDITGIYVSEAFAGRLHFWMTSWDGGRESDRSNFGSVDIP